MAKILELIASFSREERVAFEKGLDELKPPAVQQPASAKEPALPSRPKATRCPDCGSSALQRHGRYRDRYRYKCLSCSKTFNDLTNTPVAKVRTVDKIHQFAAQMAEGGSSLRKSAADLDISLPTAFNWRHRVINGYNVVQSRKLVGIVEADETFFRYSEKGDKTVSQRRKPRNRSDNALKAGISDEPLDNRAEKFTERSVTQRRKKNPQYT